MNTDQPKKFHAVYNVADGGWYVASQSACGGWLAHGDALSKAGAQAYAKQMNRDQEREAAREADAQQLLNRRRVATT